MIAPSPTPLTPEHALAYLRELQPRARDVALLGPDGVLVGGVDGEPARAARALQREGGGRSVEASVLAVARGAHAVAAIVPDAGGALAAYDLGCVASALDVRFAG